MGIECPIFEWMKVKIRFRIEMFISLTQSLSEGLWLSVEDFQIRGAKKRSSLIPNSSALQRFQAVGQCPAHPGTRSGPVLAVKQLQVGRFYPN